MSASQHHANAKVVRAAWTDCKVICKSQVCLCVQGHIGLNEVAIGISVPLYWGRLMARVIGDKQAEHLCKNAALLSPHEALKVSHLEAAPVKGCAERVTHAHL